MGPYELLMIVGSIVIFGLIPPIAVGWFSFRQGKKGYEEAVHSRDVAFQTLDSMNVKMEDAFKKLDELPTSKELLNQIQKSVQGSYGQLLKGAKAEMEGNLDEAAEQIADKIPQEQKMAMIGQRMQSAIMDKVMGFLS